MKKTLITLLVIAVLAVGGYFGFTQYRKAQAAKASTYSTDVVTRGELTAIIGATGSVRANQTAVVTWQTSGQIATMDASIDQVVNADQSLASLASSTLSQSLILARADLITAQRNLDNLLNSNTAAAQAYLTMVQAKKALEDAEKNQTNKKYYTSSQDSIDNARASLTIAEDSVKRAQEIFDQFANLPDSDVMRANALSSLAAARQQRDRALANLNALLAKPDAIFLDEASAKVELAKAQLADATREWERLKDGPDANDITAAQVRIEAIQASLELSDLKAPFAGTITEVHSLVGDLVSPGTASFRIDDLSHLLVDIQVTEVDINRIQLDQPVTLTFDAILNWSG
jgi:HlyD family secretion protein